MRVRIKKSAKPGDQQNFELVTGLETPLSQTGSPEGKVKQTMGSIPREEANAEVEGGETVVGDINSDGYIEHFTFVGPGHDQGGIPVSLPQGSFVFSDSDKLKIKDKKLLRENFNYSGKEATPAAVSKKFKLNDYVSVLRKGEGDEFNMNTAQIMIDTNTKKLAELSLVQEAMKGFPTGIPAIAESVLMGSDQDLPQAELGGEIPKMADGGSIWSTLMKAMKEPVIGETRSTTVPIPKKETPPERPKPTPAKPGEYSAKKMTPATSGNRRVDEAIMAYRKNPTKGEARKLMAFIEQAYPETRDNSPFLALIPGYQDSFLENDFVKKAYQDAMFLDDASYGKSDDYRMTSQKDILAAAKSFYDEGTAQVRSGDLLPGEIQALEKELGRVRSAVESNTYDMNVDRWYFSRKQDAPTGPVADDAAPVFEDQAPVSDEAVPFMATTPEDIPVAPVSNSSSTPVRETPVAETQKPTSQKPEAPAAKLAKTRYKILAEFEKGGQVMSEGGEPKHNIQVALDEDTGAYVVINKTTGKPIFSTYVSDARTPGGSSSGFAGMSGDDFVGYVKNWIGALGIRGDQITSAKDFQNRIYEHEMAKNPGKVADVWAKIGLNNAALNDPELTAKLMASGVLNPSKGNVLDFSKISEGDRATILKDLMPYYSDGMIGARTLGFTPTLEREKVDPIAVPERKNPFTPLPTDIELEAPDIPKTAESKTPVPQTAQRKTGGWYLQDTVNLAGAMTDPINRYEPLLSQVDLETVDPTFRDPSRMIAANQEQQSKYQEMVTNSMDPSVAAAVMLGASGQAFEQIANGLSEVEMQNAQIANQSAQANAGIRNQEQIANTEALGRYVGEMATLNQNLDNSRALKKARVNAAWNNGMTNWYRKKAMEQVLFPQTYQNPITGNWEFSDQKRDVRDPQTYQGAGTQTAAELQNLKGLEIERNLQLMKDLEAKGYTREQIESASKLNAGNTRTSTEFNERMLMAQMAGAIPYSPL